MFNYTSKPFNHDDSDDDDDDEDNFGNGKAKGYSKKRKAESLKDKKSQKKAVLEVKKPVPTPIDDDGDSDDEVTILEKAEKDAVARSEVFRLLAQSNVDYIEELVNPVGVDIDNEDLKKARALLLQMNTAKQKLTLRPVIEYIQPTPLPASRMVLPTVKKRTAPLAAYYVKPVEVTAESLLDSLFTGSSSSSNPKSSSSAAASAGVVDDGAPRIRLKTRLNDKHEWRVKFAATDKFGKLREGLSKMYNIPAALIKMKLDGDLIRDNQTPEDLDLEDDTLIDLSIPKEKYDAAVAAASEKKAGDDVAAAEVAVAAIPTIRIRTRLNGKHEGKFKIPPNEKFAVLRSALSKLYDIPAAHMKMSFDGALLKDDETPNDVDMEDEMLIDLSVPKEKYDAAVAAAGAKKAGGEVAVTAAVTVAAVALPVIAAPVIRAHVAAAPVVAARVAAAPVVATTPSLNIRTRLNGKHEGKFELLPNERFSVLRAALWKMYGIIPSLIKLYFHGGLLIDQQSPNSVGIFDNALIDVKIAATKYDAAVLAAGVKVAMAEAEAALRAPAPPAFVPAPIPVPTASSTSSSTPKPTPPQPLAATAIAAATAVVAATTQAAVVQSPQDGVELVVVHISVPQWFTTLGTSTVELDVTVRSTQTLQSMDDSLSKQSNLKLNGCVSYVLTSATTIDLNPTMTFGFLGVKTGSTLVPRYKPVVIAFIVDGFYNAKMNTPILEPVNMKVRLNKVLGDIFYSIGGHIGRAWDTLDFTLNGVIINESSRLSLQDMGVVGESRIIVTSRRLAI